MADTQKFPGPVYTALSPGVQPPPPSPVQRLFDWVPIHDLVAARVGFTKRFDRAVNQLDVQGGPALRSAQCHFHFGERLHLSIDPRIVKTQISNTVIDRNHIRWIGTHFLDGSDWGPILLPLAKSAAHREIVEICRMRHDFRKGARYRKYADSIQLGTTIQRNRIVLDTIEKLDGYFEYYLALIENIESNGIISHSDLRLRDRTGRHHRWTRTFWQDLAERDIGVAIDANGHIVRHTSGRHRMAAALTLGLERIPVEVRLVHARWLRQQSERLSLAPADALVATLEQARTTGWPTP